MADAGVPGLADELHAFLLELYAGSCDVRDAERDPRLVGREDKVLPLGFPEAEGDVGRLELTVCHLALGEAEQVAIPRQRTGRVPSRNRDEVDELNAHGSHDQETSRRRTAVRRGFMPPERVAGHGFRDKLMPGRGG